MENTLPEGWEWKKLGDLIELKYGKGLKKENRDTSGKFPVYGSNGIVDYHREAIVFEPCLIVGRKGSIGAVHLSKSPCWAIDTTYYILPPKEVDLIFLFYLLPTLKLENLNKSTAIPGLNREDVYSKLVPVPPLETQQKIVSILEKVEETKKLRAQADELTQKLIQSVFLEMFGDPVENPNQFDVIQLKSVFSEEKEGTKCGPFGSALKKHEYVKDGIPVWTMDNIVENKFTTNGCLFITEGKYQELKAYSVDEGDILISRAGTVGKMCVVSSIDCPSIISTNLIRLSLNPSKIQPIYFTSLMTYFKDRMGRLKTGEEEAYTFMNTGILKDLRIPLPPFKLQRSFARIVEQVEKTRYSQQQSSFKINTLFDALMQKAFTGDLVL